MRKWLPLLLLGPVLGGSRCRKHPDEDPVLTDVGQAVSPDVEIQVAGIEPDMVAPGRAFSATVYGSGFKEGARVKVGTQALTATQVQGDNSITGSLAPFAAGTYDVIATNPDGQQAILRGGLIVEVLVEEPTSPECDLIRVAFDFDSSSLSSSARDELDSKAHCFTQRRGTVRIEGHCDERGTTSYNLALGQRRAEAIERYLVGKGIPRSRLSTVSYGEERPLTPGTGEGAWTQNRRGEIRVGQ